MKGLKKLRRLFALLMAMIMVMGTCITTQAADIGNITITNAVVGETYNIYKLFDLTYNETTGSYYYTVTSGWESFFETGGAGASYVDISATGGVTWKDSVDSEDAKNLASEALAYAKETSNGIEAIATKEATGSTLEFDELDYGYYLVDSNLGALFSLTAANPEVEIAGKYETPTVTKTVEENSTSEYGVENTAGIGDTVNFRTEIKGASNATGMALIDVMSNGLTLDGSSIRVASGESLSKATEMDSSDYSLQTNVKLSSGETAAFVIEFGPNLNATLTSSDVIYVTYTATVTSKAVIGEDGNQNKAWIEYGNSQKSTESETNTYVNDLYIYKYYKEGNQEKPLEGAKFVLYKYVSDEANYAILDEYGYVNGWTGDKESATSLVSGSDGLIRVIGLDADDYYLEETEAPAGYSPLSDPVEFTITDECDLEDKNGKKILDKITVDDESHLAIMIKNSQGSEMPSTGGIGTTIFYVIGSIMALGAAVVLITRRRMHES